MATTTRFELPALNLNFGSITDGTNIPPPPDSPVEKPVDKKPTLTAATTPLADANKDKDRDDSKAANVKGEAPVLATANGSNHNGVKRPADDVPPSPASTRRGSLRRIFSRNMLNNSYAEGQESHTNGVPATSESRPPSRDAYSLMDDRKSRRSSGWFKRLRGGDGAAKRSSLVIDMQKNQLPVSASMQSPRGPPPPMIPELKELEKDEGSLGNDLFKNIN
jgi:hypothetical protein